MRSTFAGFTTAQLGLRASQYGLNTTGQNISNINTRGYTRQVVDQVSLNLKNGGRYATGVNVGHGVMVTGISQVRDPYLDIRFRNEVAKVGEADVKLSGLQEIESILDEVAKDGIQSQLGEMVGMLQKLSTKVSSKEFENMVKSSADSLTKFLNQCAKQLETVRENSEYNLSQVDIPEVNNILSNIAELNKSIKDGQINGNPALELVDQRNVLIDELSSYLKIDVKYVPTKISENLTIDELKIDFVGANNTINLLNHLEHVSFEVPISQLNIVNSNGQPLKDANGNPIIDANGDPVGNAIKTMTENHEYSLSQVDIPEINKILSNIADLNKSITDGQINGTPVSELTDQRNVLIDELSTYIKIDARYVPTQVNGVPVDQLKIDYLGEDNTINILDHLDHVSFEVPEEATTMQLNIVNSDGRPFKDADGNPVGNDIFSELTTGSLKGSLDLLNSSGEFDGANAFKGIGYYQNMLDVLANKIASTFNDINNVGLPEGTLPEDLHNLFASTDGGPITAKNICIASGWTNSEYGITASVTADGSAPASGANENILKMIDALQGNHSFVHEGTLPDTSDDVTLFNGSFNEYVSNLNSTLGIDIKSTSTLLDNYVSVAQEIANAKDSISGVNLDEEGMNLLKYQKSYAAAARLMTTLDEALDTIINKMGVVGR